MRPNETMCRQLQCNNSYLLHTATNKTKTTNDVADTSSLNQ